MKILLIQPPLRVFDGAAKPSVSLPVGLLMIAGVLEEKGYHVSVLDAQVNIQSPVYVDNDGRTYVGKKWDAIEVEIAQLRPDIVGISNMFTVQLESAIRVAEIAKRVDLKILTVIGGSHASVRPNDFFSRTSAVDIVCIGEGEYTMLEIARSCENHGVWARIAGTAVRWDGGVKINEPRPPISDLDALPFPAYHLVDLENYFLLNTQGLTNRPVWAYLGVERALSVITSRGCPFDCVFCSIHLHMGCSWRSHSVPYVMRHLVFLASKYKVRHIHFEDDNLTLDQQRFRDLLGEFLKSGLTLTWDTPNGVRIDTLTKDILLDCRRSGCTYLIFGVESGNKRVLNDIIGKRLDLDIVLKIASQCKDIGLDTMAFFVIGFPGETKEEMQDTVRFALDLQRRCDVMPSLFIATPLPGTKLEQVLLEKGILREPLPPDVLAKMTSGGEILDMEAGQKDGVKLAMAIFYRGLKHNMVRNFFLFCAGHPIGALRFLCRWYKLKKRIGGKEAALNLLEFKHNLLRGFVNG